MATLSVAKAFSERAISVPSGLPDSKYSKDLIA
jgi:hypothetical protein